MIYLHEMTRYDFIKFKERTIVSYAQDIHENIGVSMDEALKMSKDQTQALLPDGPETARHGFLSILIKDPKTVIGHLWYQGMQDPKEVFIFHLEIFEEYRNRGFATMAMHQFEIYLKDKGIQRIRLNVFKKNGFALRLYEDVGFEVTNMQMQKDI